MVGRQGLKKMVDILLATYNSSRFLPEALDSIFAQDFSDWRLLIRDGGSSDSTLAVLQEYARLHPGKITILPACGQASACQNFAALLEASSAPYVAFCDHDDVWLPDKLSRSLAFLRQHEQKAGSDKPALLFTDMLVSDKTLAVVNRSYFAYQHLDPRNVNLSRLLVQNVPCGCTMLVNRPLIDACGTIPPQAVMHDHWLALVGAAMGTIVCLDEPTLLYRQHGGNIFGASEYGARYFIRRALSGPAAIRDRFYRNVVQAGLFLQRYRSRLRDEDIEALAAFSSLAEMNWLQKRRTLIRHRVFKTGLLRNAGMMLIV